MKKRPFVIGIAGATGSGKTWFANKLKEALSVSACIFAMDSYSKSAEFVNGLEYHYDNPQAIDFDKAFVDLNTIIQGGAINFPIYDYKTHSVVSEIIISDPAVIIIEGLYAFYDKRFLEVMDSKIWIEADESLCLERRVKRDVAERGESLDVATYRHVCDSRPAFSAFYVMNRKYADCIIPNANINQIHSIMNPEIIEIGILIFSVLVSLALLIGAWRVISRKRNIWYVYKSRYIIMAISIVLVLGLLCCAVLIPSVPQNIKELAQIFLIPILTGLIASILYGLFSFENNIKFAETISQEVSGIVDDTCPYKVYPPVKERENNVEEDLLGSLINSNKYYYSGLGMTVASECIAKYVERKTGKGNKHNTDCITDMVFIIPNPNNPNPADSEKNNMVKEEMKKSFEKIYNSIRDLDFHLEVKFLVLPYRPPLHIHMTDTLCFWGLVDKYKNCPFPTTYCYRFSEGSESMYETIKHIFIQTEYQVARGVGKMVKLENDGNGKIECVAFTDRKEIKTIDGLINEMNIKNE